MNDKRDLLRFPEQAVKASQINAMGLIDGIFTLRGWPVLRTGKSPSHGASPGLADERARPGSGG